MTFRLLAALLLTLTFRPTLADCTYPARVLRVIDGDTVVVSIELGLAVTAQRRLRFTGIDAPELRGAEASAGAKARQTLVELLAAHADRGYLRIEGEDSFGRVLGTLYLDPLAEDSVAARLLTLGAAQPYRK